MAWHLVPENVTTERFSLAKVKQGSGFHHLGGHRLYLVAYQLVERERIDVALVYKCLAGMVHVEGHTHVVEDNG